MKKKIIKKVVFICMCWNAYKKFTINNNYLISYMFLEWFIVIYLYWNIPLVFDPIEILHCKLLVE